MSIGNTARIPQIRRSLPANQDQLIYHQSWAIESIRVDQSEHHGSLVEQTSFRTPILFRIRTGELDGLLQIGTGLFGNEQIHWKDVLHSKTLFFE